jgi:16S rRNA (guanine527-N7)-methyltransferase
MSEAGEFATILASRFGPCGELSPSVVSELFRHYSLLLRWNCRMNLTSISGLEEAVVRHYCESLFLGVQVPAGAVSVLDVGSGAGFPGVPMAILRPDCTVTLAESHRRKAVFLREATRHLANVRVAACRAEEVAGRFDWVVSRAVGWVDVLKVARASGAAPGKGGVDGGWSAEGSGPAVGLLLGEEDAEAVRVGDGGGFEWGEAVHLPWGNRRVLMVGRCRRP